MSPVERAARHVGSQKILADLLQVTPGFVSQWVTGRREVPLKYCPTIERLTSGEVRCEEIRGDIDWSFLRSASQKEAA